MPLTEGDNNQSRSLAVCRECLVSMTVCTHDAIQPRRYKTFSKTKTHSALESTQTVQTSAKKVHINQ